jgi:hypothetical protein
MTGAEWLAAADPQPMLDHLGTAASERKLRLFYAACVRRVWQLLPEGPLRRAVDVGERHADGDCSAEEYARVRRQAADAYAVVGGEGDAAYALYIQEGMDWTARKALADDDPECCWDAIANACRQARTRILRQDAPLTMARYEAAMAMYLGLLREIPLTSWAQYMQVHEICAVAVSEAGLLDDPPQKGEEHRFMQSDPGELEYQSRLLRDIFPDPSGPVPQLAPVWLEWGDGTVRKLAESAYAERVLPEGTLDVARLALVADALEDAGCTDAELLGHLRGPGPHVRGCRALDLVLGRE